MGIWDALLSRIPRPFKYIQRHLNIEKEWAEFKANLRPHRYKIRFGLLLLTAPLYYPYLKKGLREAECQFSEFIRKESQPTQPAFQWTQNTLKHLFSQIFTDQKVKDEALGFVMSLLKDQKFSESILTLLLQALKSESFLRELKLAVKDILVEELRDPEVQASINNLLENIAKSTKVKSAFISLIQEVFSSQQSVDTIVNLLKKGVVHEEVKGALGESVNFAVREVLADEETLSQLKIFIFFLLRKFENDDEIKGMMDILFAKGLGLVKKKKDNQLQKILRPASKKTDVV